MIKFVNLETGNIYDGSQPYIHWFPGQQSTGLVYVMPLCIIKNKNDGETQIKLNSDVFSLINPETTFTLENINGSSYINLEDLKTNLLSSDPATGEEKLEFIEVDNYKIAIIYIAATSNTAAEYVDTLYINDNPYNIGIDFYNEDETLSINLSNLGVEIPESVQKAIYPVNVHEEAKDNITLNRKFKELLSNYWDIIANKGSYKSLLNSLKWFEWGDIVRIREIWKHEDFAKTIYDDRALCSILEDKYKDSLTNFSKTTYMALYAAMQKLKMDNGEYLYDDEKNPELEAISSMWSRNDLMLKMCLLGNFYETYFMPIHLDLIHSTIEDIVFTNTIKVPNGATRSRQDIWFNVEQSIDCNVKDNDVFYLSNVSAQVGPNTLFGYQFNDNDNEQSYDDMHNKIVGVDRRVDILETNNDLKTLHSQLYDGVGSIVKFICKIKLDPDDFITREQITTNRGTDDWITLVNNNIFTRNSEGYTTIIFNLLCKNASDYDVKLQFNSAGSRVYTYNVKFKVIDISNAKIGVYKIVNKKEPLTIDMWYGDIANKYMFNRTRIDDTKPNLYTQYLPTSQNGVRLNNVLILTDGTDKDFAEDETIGEWLNENYFITYKNVKDQNNIVKYTIGVSKIFEFDPSTAEIFNIFQAYIYRNDYVYFPEFHELKEIDGDELNDYIVYDEDALAVVPTLSQRIYKGLNSMENYEDKVDFTFGKNIEGYEWEFQNVSTGETIELKNSVLEPNIANNKNSFLPNGYYNIIFRYNLIGDSNSHELRLNSAFIKK